MKKLLIIVDMQNDFVTGCLGSREAQAIVPDLKDFAEKFDGDIIFTRDTHDENYPNTQEGRKLPVPHCYKGTDGWQIIPELRGLVRGDSDSFKGVFDKPCFGSTELALYLKDRGDYDDITLVGVCTGICVVSNALLIKSFLPEVSVHVNGSLCACVTPESHEHALAAMRTCQVDVY